MALNRINVKISNTLFRYELSIYITQMERCTFEFLCHSNYYELVPSILFLNQVCQITNADQQPSTLVLSLLSG